MITLPPHGSERERTLHDRIVCVLHRPPHHRGERNLSRQCLANTLREETNRIGDTRSHHLHEDCDRPSEEHFVQVRLEAYLALPRASSPSREAVNSNSDSMPHSVRSSGADAKKCPKATAGANSIGDGSTMWSSPGTSPMLDQWARETRLERLPITELLVQQSAK
ncbi:hypothetical protein PG985_004930 [Apiospora marii]|uniref:Uncharacterized protein n=1 Tax=Apiospora marii TaxID=335849 RepID=A0ABR1SAE3_9PEZI